MRRLLPLLLLIGCAPPGGEEPGGPDALGEELSSPDAHREDLSSSDAPRGEGLPGPDVLSWPDPAGVGARLVFEAEPAGFFDQPFPFDLRRSHTGAPDLTGFPNPFGLPVVDTYVDAIGPVLDGFSPAGTAYLRFDGPLDLDAFPDPAASASADSPVLLVCVDPACPAYGVPVPLELAYYGATPPAEGYYLQPFLLMAKPLQGFPLREGERYALLVRRSLGDGAGRLLGPSEVLERVLRGEAVAAAEEAVAAALAPGLDWLDSAGIDRGEVAALTVFTTARPTLEMRRAADFVRTQLPAPALAGPVEQLKVADNHVLWKGTYTAPNFQRGEPPYDAGGGFVFDPDGNPVVQWQETITFALSVPEGPVPKGGWPLVMYSHGTGGSYLSLKGSTATRFADLGIAVIGIDQPFHGERYHGPPIDVEIYSFNFINVEAGRTNFRQAVLDNVSLRRFVAEGLEFPLPGGASFRADPARVGFFGHSHGGLVGAMYVPLEADLRAALLSGAGGGLAYTLMLRTQINANLEINLREVIAGLLGVDDLDEMTVFHPMINLLQMGVDATDPIHYAPHFFEDRFRPELVPIMVTEGLDDPYTPALTAEGMAIAGGIPPVGTLLQDNTGFALRGLTPLPLPVQDNILTSDHLRSTAGLMQFEGFGHYPVFDSDEAVAAWKHFMKTALIDLEPGIAR